jgi:hypothetical protein
MKAFVALLIAALMVAFASEAHAAKFSVDVEDYGATFKGDTVDTDTDTVRFKFDQRQRYATATLYLWTDYIEACNLSVQATPLPDNIISCKFWPDSNDTHQVFNMDSLDQTSTPDSIYWEDWSGTDSLALIPVPTGYTLLHCEEYQINSSGILEFYVTADAAVSYMLGIYVFRR